jgi:hypothetical protein
MATAKSIRHTLATQRPECYMTEAELQASRDATLADLMQGVVDTPTDMIDDYDDAEAYRIGPWCSGRLL